MASPYTAQLTLAKKVAVHYGKEIKKMRLKGVEVMEKPDGSKTTSADMYVSNLIGNALGNAHPGYGILDEEHEKEDPRRYHKSWWLLDPIDGTDNYIAGGFDYGIQLALIHRGVPVLGVRYSPAIDELIYAEKGEGAWRLRDGNLTQLFVSESEKLKVVTSKSVTGDDLSLLQDILKVETITCPAAARKIIDVATGEATTFVLPPKKQYHLWDVCAPEVILNEAGGTLTDLRRHPIDYRGNVKLEHGLVATHHNHEDVVALLQKGGFHTLTN